MTSNIPNQHTPVARPEAGSLAAIMDGMNYRGVDTKGEAAVLKSDLPDTPMLSILEDGQVVVGLTGVSSAHHPCQVSLRGNILLGRDMQDQKTLFEIPVDDKNDLRLVTEAMKADALTLCEATEHGITLYTDVTASL